MKNKITLVNSLSTLFLQFVTIISSFVIPRLIIRTFGSDINGLVSSLTQFLSYVSLIEGGITGVIMAALYKPITMRDKTKINSIIVTAKNFYKRISYIYIVYTLLLAVIYPIIFNTTYSFAFVFSLTIILALSLLIQYMFSLALRNLLNADKKIYIVSLTQSTVLILGIIFAVISVKIYPNIHIFKFLTGLAFILQPIIYRASVKKYYNLDKNAKEDKSLIKSRWDGFAINIAAFIHNSTDITVLTIFKPLTTVSVYSVYSLVSIGLNRIISATTSSLNPTIGQAYAKKDKKGLNEKLDLYEYIVFMLVSFCFSMAGLLIVPFVMIYTSGVNDADYYQPLFAILLLISEALYLVKFPHLNLAYSANKFKEIAPSGFIEAGINIILSVILVPTLGLIGVAIGTIVAMTYRLVYHVSFTSKMLKERKQSTFYKKLGIMAIASLISIIISASIAPSPTYSVFNWLWHAAIYGIVIGVVLLVTSKLFFKKEYVYIKKYLIKKG